MDERFGSMPDLPAYAVLDMVASVLAGCRGEVPPLDVDSILLGNADGLACAA